MRPAFTALTAILSAAILCSCAHTEPEMNLSGNPMSPPMNWMESGDLVGVGPECARIALSNMGVKVDTLPAVSWQDTLDKAKDGRIDIIPAIFRNEERSKYLLFSIPYMDVPTLVYVKRGSEFPFSRWEDLKGRKGLMGLGESYGEDFDKFAASSLDISRHSIPECFKLLVSGSADYLVIGKYAGSIESFRTGLSSQTSFLSVPVGTQSYHMAVSKKSPLAKRMEQLNLKLKSMKVDGTPERLAASYLIKWRNRFIERRDATLE